MILAFKFILAHALTFGSPASTDSQFRSVTQDTTVVLRDSIVNYAKSFLGTPYKYACASPSGFDCSGFTWFVFNHFKIEVPRSSKDYQNFGSVFPLTARVQVILYFSPERIRKRRG
jgi:cell wall-associated NlpC family hydrolase